MPGGIDLEAILALPIFFIHTRSQEIHKYSHSYAQNQGYPVSNYFIPG